MSARVAPPAEADGPLTLTAGLLLLLMVSLGCLWAYGGAVIEDWAPSAVLDYWRGRRAAPLTRVVCYSNGTLIYRGETAEPVERTWRRWRIRETGTGAIVELSGDCVVRKVLGAAEPLPGGRR